MPCRDDRDSSDYAFENGKESGLKQLTPLLCEACSLLEEIGVLDKVSVELRKWYQEHEKCEIDRVRYEAALKLSERERRLFGIDLESLRIKVKLKGQIK